jgi:hypothetical protein
MADRVYQVCDVCGASSVSSAEVIMSKWRTKVDLCEPHTELLEAFKRLIPRSLVRGDGQPVKGGRARKTVRGSMVTDPRALGLQQ